MRGCGSYHARPKRVERGGGRLKKFDCVNPTRWAKVGANRAYRRRAKLAIVAQTDFGQFWVMWPEDREEQ